MNCAGLVSNYGRVAGLVKCNSAWFATQSDSCDDHPRCAVDYHDLPGSRGRNPDLSLVTGDGKPETAGSQANSSLLHPGLEVYHSELTLLSCGVELLSVRGQCETLRSPR